jgi:rod shape-determining protein MreC
MNYRSKSNFNITRRGKNNIFFLPLVIFFIIFVLLFSFSSTRGFLFKIGYPFWFVKNSISSFFVKSSNLLKSKNSLIEENYLLRDTIKNNTNDVILLDLIKKENADLKGFLGRKTNNSNIILATILVKPAFLSYDTLLIDIGISDGVSVGDKVLADGNVFIGYVSEAYNNMSKVILYSSPNEKTKVLVGNNNIEKEALGIGSGNFRLETPREIDIKEGDVITIPSLSLNIFGIVEKVEYKDADSFQSVYFKNPVNISELKWVQVVLGKNN